MTSTSRSKASAQTLQFRASPRRCSSRAASGLWDEILDQGRYVRQLRHIIRPASLERGARHFRKRRIFGILHDRDAAAALQGLQAGGSVAERASQHDPQRTMAIAERDRSEQGIDGRTGIVLARPISETKRPSVLVQQQM